MKSTLAILFAALLALPGCTSWNGSPPSNDAPTAPSLAPAPSTAPSTSTTAPPLTSTGPVYFSARLAPAPTPNGTAVLTVGTLGNPNTTAALEATVLMLGWDVTSEDLGVDLAARLNEILLARNETIGFLQLRFRGASELLQLSVPHALVGANGSLQDVQSVVVVSAAGGAVAVTLPAAQAYEYAQALNGTRVVHVWRPTTEPILYAGG